MNITKNKIIILRDVITNLSDAATSETNKAKLPKMNFKGKVLYALTKNYKKLDSIFEDVEKTRVTLVRKYNPDNKEQIPDENRNNYTKEIIELLDEVENIEFHQIDVNDLELDKNQIPVQMLSQLMDTVVAGELK